MITRRFVIKCSSSDVCVELLNKIMEEISARWMKTQVKGNTLIIEAIGMPYELKSLRYEIENIKRGMEVERMKGGRYSVEDLVKGAKTTVPLDALLLALTLKGFKAKREGEYIITNAPGDTIIDVMRGMSEVLENDEVRFKLPSSAKKIVMVLHTVYDIDPERIIEIMKNYSIIEEADFGYRLKEEWRSALRRLVKLLTSDEWGLGRNERDIEEAGNSSEDR
ncbi:hypothetical protein IPA_05085 [Ignicoccus pacificus DSM 13166]|uniref:DUF2067 domain-containing protein n=1 Tax=Ignicoccus pacificus DSM 13166 TaxID=940294 RepID=A0A977KC85_9CREN|nr:hypothetical protein IPA_05085 [Ignicoccus pacificus DSM 13166]